MGLEQCRAHRLSFAGSLFLSYPHLALLEVPDPPSLVSAK
jgi:hypothetical protein